MVLGLVWDVIRWRDRSARCCDRLVPCVSGRLLALRRVLLPGGGPLQQHPDVREHQLGFPFRSAPRSVSSRAEQSGAVEASEGRAKTDCGAGSENGKSMRVEEEEHAQRSRFLAGRGHSWPMPLGFETPHPGGMVENSAPFRCWVCLGRAGLRRVWAPVPTRVRPCPAP